MLLAENDYQPSWSQAFIEEHWTAIGTGGQIRRIDYWLLGAAEIPSAFSAERWETVRYHPSTSAVVSQLNL